MSGKPVLAIQPRRLGDLILSIPLFARLRALYPKSPLWIVAEPAFYGELAPLLPMARFFAPGQLPALAKIPYEAIVNLGAAQEAANFTGKAEADLKLGRVAAGNSLRVCGFWQLYRHSLTQNNRHNTFHWSDLDFLDLYSSLPIPQIPHARPEPADKGIVGLFVGASDAAKRPDALFWGRLARMLAREGRKPVLLGGKGEVALGREISAHCGPQHVNMCGRLSLSQLAATLRTFDLLITPDTGPMHLANLAGTPVLNLSMGNVHAAETGPASPGQFALRAAMSCSGCWKCQRPKLYCKAAFNPLAVANVALAIMRRKEIKGIAAATPPGLELWLTARDSNGLLRLEPAPGEHSPQNFASLALDAFWRAAFLDFAFPGANCLARTCTALREQHGALAKNLARSLSGMAGIFNRAMRKNQPLPDDFWQRQPRHSQLFAGHAQMFLQNADYNADAWKTSIERAASLSSLLA